MISIKKDFVHPPERLSSALRSTLILDSLVTKNKHSFEPKVYREATLDSLNRLYNSKCAYCETDTSAGAPMQVEHYRPKGKITNDKSHLGYYWIAYEWSNLILCCSKCNNRKGSHFPLTGIRVVSPLVGEDGFPLMDFMVADSVSFENEGALILHPEIDSIEDHFIFNERAEIVGRTRRAIETIRICDLNRKELVFKRLSILNAFLSDIKEILEDYLRREKTEEACRYALKLIFTKIFSLQLAKNQYSRFGFFLFAKFDFFIAKKLQDKQRKAVKILFTQFLNGTL